MEVIMKKLLLIALIGLCGASQMQAAGRCVGGKCRVPVAKVVPAVKSLVPAISVAAAVQSKISALKKELRQCYIQLESELNEDKKNELLARIEAIKESIIELAA
jgi:hypothetical protein